MSEMSCSQCGGIYGSGQEIERLRLDIVQRDEEIAVYEHRVMTLQGELKRLQLIVCAEDVLLIEKLLSKQSPKEKEAR